MDSSSIFDNNSFMIAIIVVSIISYYYAFWRYNEKIKNNKSIKNINSSVPCVNNFHILAKNIESVPLDKTIDIKSKTEEIKSPDWFKVLNEIQDQAQELNNNNHLYQILNDMDIDTED